MYKKKGHYNNAYEPYMLEALFCFGIDLLLLLIWVVVCYKFGLFENIFFCIVIPIYFLVEIFTNYRIPILSILERANKAYISTSFCISEIREEWSASGPWGSIIPNLYPSRLDVGRYKVIGTDNTSRKLKLRFAISEKNV